MKHVSKSLPELLADHRSRKDFADVMQRQWRQSLQDKEAALSEIEAQAEARRREIFRRAQCTVPGSAIKRHEANRAR